MPKRTDSPWIALLSPDEIEIWRGPALVQVRQSAKRGCDLHVTFSVEPPRWLSGVVSEIAITTASGHYIRRKNVEPSNLGDPDFKMFEYSFHRHIASG